MEEDAGKLIHDENENITLVDYNRSGVPLIEIVSNLTWKAQRGYRLSGDIAQYDQYLGASDCKLNEGSMRADVNLSVRPSDSDVFGTRTEMKNLNSFRSITRAIKAERERQIRLLEAGEKVVQESRRWDDRKAVSYSMRSKEDAKDYRYFPEPDLVPVYIDDEWIEQVRAAQPEFREAKAQRYMKEFRLPAYDADIITESKRLADIFEATIEFGVSPKEASNWIMVEVMRLCRDFGMDCQDVSFSPENLAKLIRMVENQEINRTVAKEVLEQIFTEDADPEQYVEEHQLQMKSDLKELEKIVSRAIAESPQAVADFMPEKERCLRLSARS